MLWNLDGGSLFIAVGMVAMVAFILGMVLDGVMGDDGFGPIGNMIVTCTGFFIAVFTANIYGYNLASPTLAAGAGLSGAFISIFSLALLKAGLGRFMSS